MEGRQAGRPTSNGEEELAPYLPLVTSSFAIHPLAGRCLPSSTPFLSWHFSGCWEECTGFVRLGQVRLMGEEEVEGLSLKWKWNLITSHSIS